MTQVPYAFVSYSRRDEAFAARLGIDLRAQGVEIWLDQLDIRPGEPYDQAIQRGLHEAQTVLLLLSPASVQSENVRNELELAKSKRKQIVPIKIAPVDELPLDLGRLQFIDFTHGYASGLRRLVGALRGAGSRTEELRAVVERTTPAHHQPYPPAQPPPQAQYSQGQYSQPQHSPQAHWHPQQPWQPPTWQHTPARSSLEPTYGATPRQSRSQSGLVIGLFGAGIGATVLFIMLVALVPSTPSGAAGSSAINPLASSSTRLASDPVEVVPAVLQGRYRQDCFPDPDGPHIVATQSFDPGGFEEEAMFYADAQCSEPLFASHTSWRVLAVHARAHGIYEVDLELARSYLVPIAAAALLNSSNAAQVTDWQDGVAKAVAQRSGIAIGTRAYDLVSLQGPSLFLSGVEPALTPEARPQTINPEMKMMRVN